MRIAVLCGPDSWYYRDLHRAAVARGHEMTACCFADLQAEVGAGPVSIRSGGADLADFDAVLIRTMPPGSLEQVVFRMNALAELQAAGVLVLNSPRSVEIAVDKFLTTTRLRERGLAVPPTIACQSADDAMEAFQQLGGDIVLKPLFGGEGRGIARVNDPALMLRAAKMLASLGAVLYLQQYIDHGGCDQRVFVLGERLLGMRRCSDGDWRTNISRGARAEPLVIDEPLETLAREAAAAVQAEIAGVDVLPDRDGRAWVLEVNGVPGWKALSRVTNCDVAAELIQHLERRVAAHR